MSESEDPLPSSILSCDYSATGDSPKPESVGGVGDAPFAFETDHEALRSNADYAALLRVMAALQAQKMQAVRDREKLIEARDKALADPIAFVKRLQVCTGCPSRSRTWVGLTYIWDVPPLYLGSR